MSLFLTSTSDLLQLSRSTTADIDVHASFADATGTPVTVTAGRTNTKFNTAATGTIVGSPAASTQRSLRTLHVQNIHASTSNQIGVIHTDGTTAVLLESVLLGPGERLAYVDGQGFELVDANGMNKVVPVVAGLGALLTARLGATVTNSTTTAGKITGLDLGLGVGAWVFRYVLRLQSATTTVGFALGCNHTGTVTTFDYTISFPTTGTLDSTGVADQVLTAPSILGVMAARSKGATAPNILTAGVDTINSDILVVIDGLAIVTVAGNLELYHASETATATSVMLDSVLYATKVG